MRLRTWSMCGGQVLLRYALLILALVCLARAPSAAHATAAPPLSASEYRTLLTQAQQQGAVRVIVGLKVPFVPEGALPDRAAVQAQHASTARAQRALLSKPAHQAARAVKLFETIPFLSVEVDAAGLDALGRDPDVRSIEEDHLAAPTLATSVPLIGANTAWSSGWTGAGQTIAVLDTGVDTAHPFFTGRIAYEACFSSSIYSVFPPGQWVAPVCPNGGTQQIGAGAGVPCSIAGCDHGTHVAGIAAGRSFSGQPGGPFSGVATMARVIPIQVFSRVNWSCGDAPAPCAKSFASDQIRALEQVLAWRTTFSIAAVNMSIGTKDQTFASVADCDASNGSTKAAIDNLRSVGIATIISAGNNGDSAGLSAPGCISSAISVGATDKNDNVWNSSNSAPRLSLLAPGVNITSSVPGGSFAAMSGTSMAAPHAAGAWAILKQRVPSATVDAILNALQCTGAEILDGRNKLLTPRIRVATALEYLAAGSKPCARLKLYWHDGRQDNFSTATAAGEQDALAAAYGFVRVEGHILRNPEPGTVPLKLYWHGGREDNFSTATAAGEQDALNVGYVGIRNEGYIFSSQRPGTVPLKLYWHAGHGDNFSTATAAGEQAALASGYTLIRVEGYVYP